MVNGNPLFPDTRPKNLVDIFDLSLPPRSIANLILALLSGYLQDLALSRTFVQAPIIFLLNYCNNFPASLPASVQPSHHTAARMIHCVSQLMLLLCLKPLLASYFFFFLASYFIQIKNQAFITVKTSSPATLALTHSGLQTSWGDLIALPLGFMLSPQPAIFFPYLQDSVPGVLLRL